MDPNKVDVRYKRLIFDDTYKISESEIRFQRYDGQMSAPIRRLVFERGDAAGAILFNRDRQKVLLIEQFRYPTYENGPGWILEVVAGMVDPGEKPEETICREIEEEIGYRVQDVMPIASFYVSPGGTSERIFLYYAEVEDSDRVAVGGGIHNEDIRLVEYSKREFAEALASGRFQDSKTLIAVQWLQLHWLMQAGS
jgi:nudix-type nucleoside diphosphatase (YffH/AdpP family)